jgi:TonB family protein
VNRFANILWRYACAFSLLFATVAMADYVPPQNLAPESSAIRLDRSYQDDAWMVYTYDIDTQGRVVNPRIITSNGVPAVEKAVLDKVSTMQFRPATRDGQPVQATADPVIFTWILDLPRDMSPSFRKTWEAAWAYFKQGDYASVAPLAEKLGATPGRNAFEEVKYRILAASLASRGGETTSELRHLQRASELQSLARDNNFQQRYIEPDQYLLILERIQALQLERMMLADAGDTLALIQAVGPGSKVAGRAEAAYRDVEGRFNALPEVTTPGELAPVYPGGPGVWKTGLSRDRFSISGVKGRVDLVYLVCAGGEIRLTYPATEPWTTPVGMVDCKIDLTGSPDTQLTLHQYAN